ncbi:MAG: hypothetical protein KDB63_09490 [Nocardioidaceae bacterium]|nr:hypothetical protein [Nocardioidaceae bacterium]
MRRRLTLNSSVPLVLAMLVVAVGAIVGQRMIAGGAFGALEASTVADDAHRVALVVDYETKLLGGYGATNSIWDDSYDAVATANEADFLADFPPSDLKAIGDADAVVGIDQDGNVRVGGLIDGNGYAPLPAGLGAERLTALVDFNADAGTGTCALVPVGETPYLSCGFPARRSDSSGSHDFGLVYFRAFDQAAMTRLSTTTGLPLEIASAGTSMSGSKAGTDLTTELGPMGTATKVLSGDTLDLFMTLPALGGGEILVVSPHDRDIHATDSSTALKTFGLMGVALLFMLLFVHLLVRRSLHNQVEPLRAATEAIIASGDTHVRVGAEGRGELAALGRTINSLLDTIEEGEAEAARSQHEREESIRQSHAQQQAAEEQAQREAQARVQTTIDAVVEELGKVLDQATRVLEAARDIDSRSTATDVITEEVLSGTAAANDALGELNSTLQQVHGIVGIIRQITEQTRMLALNANIEAARVGELGAGFRVVAHEVRTLAADTASSADEIASTTGMVTTTAERVARTLEDVTNRAVAVGTATSGIRSLASDQTITVEELATEVRLAVERVQAMASAS